MTLHRWSKGAAAALLWALPAWGANPAAGNAAPNPSFEQPEGGEGAPAGWLPFSSGKGKAQITGVDFRTGKQCVRLAAQETRGAALALMAEIPVERGQRYTFEVYLKKDPADRLRGSAHALLVVEWLNATGKEVSRATSQPQSGAVSRMKWKEIVLGNLTVPPGAVTGRFGIHLLDGDSGGGGALLVDDVRIEQDT